MAKKKNSSPEDVLFAVGVVGHVLGGVFIGAVIAKAFQLDITVTDFSGLISAAATTVAAAAAIGALSNWKKAIRYERRASRSDVLVTAFEDWKKAIRKYAYAQQNLTEQPRLALAQRMPNADVIKMINEARAEIEQAGEKYKRAWVELDRWIDNGADTYLITYDALEGFLFAVFDQLSKCSLPADYRAFHKEFLSARFEDMWSQIDVLRKMDL